MGQNCQERPYYTIYSLTDIKKRTDFQSVKKGLCRSFPCCSSKLPRQYVSYTPFCARKGVGQVGSPSSWYCRYLPRVLKQHAYNVSSRRTPLAEDTLILDIATTQCESYVFGKDTQQLPFQFFSTLN